MFFLFRETNKYTTSLNIVTVAYVFFVFHITIVQSDVIARSEYLNNSPPESNHEFKSAPALFGPEAANIIQGYAVYAQPPDGCGELNPPPEIPVNSNVTWIVLIRRGGCDFLVKVRTAQKMGYRAAIIHNVNSDDIQAMGPTDADGINIISTFIGANDGLIIKSFYTYDKGYYLTIDDKPVSIVTVSSMFIDFSNMRISLIICSSLVVISLLGIMTVFIIRLSKSQRRLTRQRLFSANLKSTPITMFPKGDKYILLDKSTEDEN